MDELSASIEPKVIAWRRDIHEHPELSNRETRTAKLVAAQLERLGLQVQTGIAHTGVVGFLKGGLPGPTVAIRADMDALPVTEKTDVPFKSHTTATYRGETVGVMHACGHDSHTAMLMGIAQIFTGAADYPNAAFSTSCSTGFTRCSSKPTSAVRRRSSACPYPDNAIRRVVANFGSDRTARATA